MTNKKKLLFMLAAVFLAMILTPADSHTSQSITLSKKQLTIYEGGTTTLKLKTSSKNVKWSSSNKKAAIVSKKGVITAKKAGQTVITVSSGNQKAVCKVIVKKQLSLKKAKDKINSQIANAKNITFKGYIGSIKECNYLSTISIGRKNKVLYVDMFATGDTKMYLTDSTNYWYDELEKKWHYYKSTNSVSLDYSQKAIAPDAKCKILGNKEFNGEKCTSIQAVNSYGEEATFYLSLSDYSLVGITSGKGYKKISIVVDTKKTVSIPASVIKNATYKKL